MEEVLESALAMGSLDWVTATLASATVRDSVRDLVKDAVPGLSARGSVQDLEEAAVGRRRQ